MPQAKELTIGPRSYRPTKQDANNTWHFSEVADSPLDQLNKLTHRMLPTRTKDAARGELRIVVPVVTVNEKTGAVSIKPTRATFVLDLPRSLNRVQRADVVDQVILALANEDIKDSFKNIESFY